MNVVQAIGEAGGFLEGAKKGDVVIVRNENGIEQRYKFNYNDVVKGKNVGQNIRLLPGDTISFGDRCGQWTQTAELGSFLRRHVWR
jgi:polysaccharide export outer membrane protein